ncbi:MAG: bifunctional adenosylcobinamide kinase/adenosylcobinamide-phosphate guanylyltransferase [Bacillota bacterium]|nr:bifunctional adenosylcobinamide kinase/adenosylcobinamide-phosphate guanylyltransferase [Bacillota bacterium]
MILIFGGAYQGKLEYARENFNVKTVCDCSDGSRPDFSMDAVYGIEGYVLDCVRKGREAADFFKENKDSWQDKVLIATDVSQGIVPLEAEQRAFREMNGRTLLYLTNEADRVYRVFCGLGKKVK